MSYCYSTIFCVETSFLFQITNIFGILSCHTQKPLMRSHILELSLVTTVLSHAQPCKINPEVFQVTPGFLVNSMSQPLYSYKTVPSDLRKIKFLLKNLRLDKLVFAYISKGREEVKWFAGAHCNGHFANTEICNYLRNPQSNFVHFS